MSCLNPLPAMMYKLRQDDGSFKRVIKILNPNKYSENRMKTTFGSNLLMLPCGHCEACKMAYRQDWATRCEMESYLHKENCFVTLTLDRDNYKPFPVKEDIQYFLHKLRDSYGIKCRYFACGELGYGTDRSHYHMILFGYMPDDLKFYGKSKSGYDMFTSKFLTKVWNKGDVKVQYFDVKTAFYTAGYVKKQKKQSFLMESTRPGLGHDYMIANFHKLFKYGHYQGRNGIVQRLPRYFKKLCEKHGYDPIHILMDKEEMMTEIQIGEKFSHGFQYDGQLNTLHKFIMKDKLKKLKREL